MSADPAPAAPPPDGDDFDPDDDFGIDFDPDDDLPSGNEPADWRTAVGVLIRFLDAAHCPEWVIRLERIAGDATTAEAELLETIYGDLACLSNDRPAGLSAGQHRGLWQALRPAIESVGHRLGQLKEQQEFAAEVGRRFPNLMRMPDPPAAAPTTRCPPDATEVLARIPDPGSAAQIARTLGYPEKKGQLNTLLGRYRNSHKDCALPQQTRRRGEATFLYRAHDVVGELVAWLKRQARTD